MTTPTSPFRGNIGEASYNQPRKFLKTKLLDGMIDYLDGLSHTESQTFTFFNQIILKNKWRPRTLPQPSFSNHGFHWKVSKIWAALEELQSKLEKNIQFIKTCTKTHMTPSSAENE